MITLQHSLCNLIRNDGNIQAFEHELPLCLLPDALRFYLGMRQYTHFEQNPEGNDISWYVFPTDIKNLTKEKVLSQPKYHAETKLKSVVGEPSKIDKFVEINKDLPRDEYYGILTHLIQDYLYDEFVREHIDFSNKYEPNAYFVFNGIKYDGKDFRKKFLHYEEYGFYILAYYCYKIYGITTNQEWFNEHVLKVLKDNYPIDLVENTYKYMIIPNDINEKITNHDFSGLTDELENKKYNEFYNKIIYYTRNIDIFFEKYKNDNQKKVSK